MTPLGSPGEYLIALSLALALIQYFEMSITSQLASISEITSIMHLLGRISLSSLSASVGLDRCQDGGGGSTIRRTLSALKSRRLSATGCRSFRSWLKAA